MFKMNDDESIASMYTRFTNIINSLTALGKVYSSLEIVRKILNSLPKRWESKVTAILEARDLKKLEVNELIGSLTTHEYTLKRGEEESKQKKSMALKAIPHESESDEDEENDNTDEEIAMITRKFRKFLKKDKASPRKPFKKISNKDTGKNDSLTCYKCRRPGHIKADCPLLKKDRYKGKKAMKATWDDESSSSDSDASHEGCANLCLMAKDDLEVTNFEVIENPSYEELQNVLEEVYEELEKLGIKYTALKKKNSSLINEIDVLKKESINSKDENLELKKKVADLEKTVENFTNGKRNFEKLLGSQRCVFNNKVGLGYMPKEKYKPHKNFFGKPTKSKFDFQNSFHKNKFFKERYYYNYSSTSYMSHITCNFCNRNGHNYHACPIRRKHTMTVRTIWVPKNLVSSNTNK